MSQLTIKFNEKCVVPIITEVSHIGTSVTLKWDIAGVDPTATYTVQYASDGVNYVNISNYAVMAGQAVFTITLPVGATVKFRLLSNTSNCSNIQSLAFDYVVVGGAKVYVSNVIREPGAGTARFQLHVEGESFVGYAHGVITNSSVNTRVKLGAIGGAGIHLTPRIVSNAPLGAEDRQRQAITLAVGVYPDCTMEIGGNTVPSQESISVDMAFILSLTTVYEDGYPLTYVQIDLQREGI